MENHPIPQDVTGFKFALIGSITVRQFAYLLVAAILVYLSWSSGIFFLIKWPLILMFGALGVGLAFIPIDGRPLDKMILLFIRALPRENEYVYIKRGAAIFDELAQFHYAPQKAPIQKQDEREKQLAAQKREALFSQMKAPRYKPNEEEESFLEKLKPFLEDAVLEDKPLIYKNSDKEEKDSGKPKKTFGFFASKEHADTQLEKMAKSQHTLPAQPTEGPAAQVVTQQPIAQPAPQTQTLNTPPQLPPQANTTTAAPTVPVQPVPQAIPGSAEAILAQQENYKQHLYEESHKPVAEKVYKVGTGQTAANDEAPHVRTVSTQTNKSAGFPVLPDMPNVVLGIVKDPRGKVIPNIIVEVLDKQNSPVRAFKTNMLGQFISATPLQNGQYKIKLEDPQRIHEFDTIEITLNGKDIFLPLEIISIDEREKLRKSLFEGTDSN